MIAVLIAHIAAIVVAARTVSTRTVKDIVTVRAAHMHIS